MVRYQKLATLLCIWLVLSGCDMAIPVHQHQAIVALTGQRAQVDKTANDYDKLYFDGPINAQIVVDPSVDDSQISYEADKAVLATLRQSVKNRVLYMTLSPTLRYPVGTQINITLQVNHLDGFTYHGNGRVQVGHINSRDFSVLATGHNQLYISGIAEQLKVSLAGNSQLNAHCFASHYSFINTKDGANMMVNNMQHLQSYAKGTGNIYYYQDNSHQPLVEPCGSSNYAAAIF